MSVNDFAGLLFVLWMAFAVLLWLSGRAYDAMARRFGWKREQR